jgi:hypothetical protein
MLQTWGEDSEVPARHFQSGGAVGVDCLLMASLDATIQWEFRLDL